MKNKKLYYSLLVIILIVLLSLFAIDSRNKAEKNVINQKSYSDSITKVIPDYTEAEINNSTENKEISEYMVYYFRDNVRCSTCYKIENYTREVFEQNFKDKYTFKVVNISESGNKHFINDYGLYTKSVVLSQNKDGQEVKFINLPKVWDNIRSEDAFKSYIKDEMEKFLNN